MTQRIGKTQQLPIDQLEYYHQNPRRGNLDAIVDSLKVNGQYRPIVVNRGNKTGREWEVLAGNHTLMGARFLDEQGVSGWREIDCYVVDVDDEQASRIVLADNRTSDLADYDERSLAALLASLDDGLEGTGYDDDDLADLSALLEEKSPLPADYGENSGGDEASGQSTTEEADSDGDGGTLPPARVNVNEETGVGGSTGTAHSALSYHTQPTRMIILNLPINQFIWAQEKFSEYLEEHKELADSNAAAVIHLLESWSGDQAPQEENEDEESLEVED